MYSGIKPKVRQKDYPCLMQDKQGNVYLMSDIETGTMVYKSPEAISPYGLSKVGDHAWDLLPSGLRPFSGEITLGEN